jgi:hypothetical protein
MGALGFNGRKRVININASTGAFLPILATGPTRKCVVEESPLKADGSTADTLVGLIQYQIGNDGSANGFTQTFEAVGGNTETAEGQVVTASFTLGDDFGDHGPLGSVIANGPQTLGMGLPPTGATALCNVRSGGAATSVIVTEWY